MTRHSTYLKRREKLAAYLEQLPRKEFDIKCFDMCVFGHARKLFKIPPGKYACDYLGIPSSVTDTGRWYDRLVTGRADVKTPQQAAKYIRQHLMGEEG